MIYEKIKKCCALKGISISQLESELEMARGSLCKIDKHKPSLEKMNRIANYLNTTVEYLMIEETQKEFVMPNYNPVTHEVIQLFDVLNNEQINMIVSITREMAKLNKNNNELTEQVKDYDEKIKYIDELEKDNDELSKKLDAYESYERFQAEEDW